MGKFFAARGAAGRLNLSRHRVKTQKRNAPLLPRGTTEIAYLRLHSRTAAAFGAGGRGFHLLTTNKAAD